MQQQTQHILEKVVFENSRDVDSLSARIIQLEVVQQAVGHLMDKIDEITYKGWHEDRGMACLSILEIQDTVRLIDMAFYPLFKEIAQKVDTLNIHAQELFDTVIENESEQSSKETTKLDINSVEGWNYFTMENNIKTYIKEFKREPESFEEVLTYISETVAKVVGKSEGNKKATAGTVTNENIAN